MFRTWLSKHSHHKPAIEPSLQFMFLRLTIPFIALALIVAYYVNEVFHISHTSKRTDQAMLALLESDLAIDEHVLRFQTAGQSIAVADLQQTFFDQRTALQQLHQDELSIAAVSPNYHQDLATIEKALAIKRQLAVDIATETNAHRQAATALQAYPHSGQQAIPGLHNLLAQLYLQTATAQHDKDKQVVSDFMAQVGDSVPESFAEQLQMLTESHQRLHAKLKELMIIDSQKSWQAIQYDIDQYIRASQNRLHVVGIILLISCVVLFILVNRLVSNLNKSQKDIQKINANLEQRIEERTNELTEANSRYQEAAEEAKQASQMKGDFLAVMSHEIRTPLNAVIGLTNVLLNSDLNNTQREYADIIRSSGENLLILINDILDFSKIESGKMHVEHIEFSLRKVIEDAGCLFHERAESKGLQLISVINAELPDRFMGDPTRISQIINNLLSNAIKFTDQGNVTISVNSSEPTIDGKPGDLSNREDVTICVTDQGIGMTEEQIGNLYDAFTQADSSTTRKYGGTGLGMAISKRIIDALHGTIAVSSEPGEGTTFSISLPLILPAQTGDSTRSRAAFLIGKRMLCLADNPIGDQALPEQCRSLGMSITLARNLAQAEAEIAQHSHEVVVLDLQDPDVPIPKIIDKLRQQSQTTTPILVSLTKKLSHLPDQVADLEQVWIIQRPARRIQLLRMISEAVGERSPSSLNKSLPEHALKEDHQLTLGRVLIAEDNVVNQKLAKIQLSSFRCTIDIANNGQEAVELVTQHDYDVILMDCEMPVCDGFTATKNIRQFEQTEQRPRTPIIALTAHVIGEVEQRCRESGMDDFLSKPIREQALTETLTKWAPAQRESESTASTADGSLPPATALDEVSHLKALADDIGHEALAEIIEISIDELPRLLERVTASADAGDLVKLKQAAHAMKGAAAGLCLESLSHQASDMEDSAGNEDLASTRAQLRQLVTLVNQAVEGLRLLMETTATQANPPSKAS